MQRGCEGGTSGSSGLSLQPHTSHILSGWQRGAPSVLNKRGWPWFPLRSFTLSFPAPPRAPGLAAGKGGQELDLVAEVSAHPQRTAAPVSPDPKAKGRSERFMWQCVLDGPLVRAATRCGSFSPPRVFEKARGREGRWDQEVCWIKDSESSLRCRLSLTPH